MEAMHNQKKAYSYIRFSSSEQEKGDSLRRQVQASEDYAKRNGLILDRSLRMTDRGLSAYKGRHKTKGALGEFLKLVEAGQIEPGSILLVENLDRLSREQVLDALNQFSSIIKAGIKLVTLQDGMEYDEESINANWSQLIVSIALMARAHEESATKAKRLSSAWENKRANIENRKMTGKAPAWLRLSDDKTKFIVIPKVAQAIHHIFHLKATGRSNDGIEKDLNAHKGMWRPPKSTRNKTGGWRKSYVTKILNNKAVIGEFQPHKLIEGKREPVGEPIKNYFPAIIDADLFYHVQDLIKTNGQMRGKGGGKTGKASNLFVHLVKCGLCGAPLHFVGKGKPPKGGNYLVCDAARRFRTCDAKPIKYEEFEELFFQNFEELDISQIIPTEDEIMTRLNALRIMVSGNNQRSTELAKEQENLVDSIAKTKDSRVRSLLEQKLSQCLKEQRRIQSRNISHEREITNLTQQKRDMQENVDKAKEVYGLLNSAKDEEERIRLRLWLRKEIQRIVSRIDIYPLQEKYREFEEIEPGIIKCMYSRCIRKVRIRFKGSGNKRLLFQTRYGEIYS